MEFLYEKQTRRFYLFLLRICVLQVCLLGVCGYFWMCALRKILIERGQSASSYLLSEGISPVVVGAAWNYEGTTREGERLFERIGHTERSKEYLWMLAEQTSVPLIVMLLAAGLLFAAILLIGAARFLRRREQIYESAENVIAQYAQNRFQRHLPTKETGAIYQLFGSIEQLAMSLRAKSEMEHKAKVFLRNMISNISHQLKTPLAALEMYMEIIREEPQNEETVRNFSKKSIQSLERMEELIGSLLKMARLDTGNIVFEKHKCFVSEMAAQAVEDLKERARCEGKEILLCGEQDARLTCDQGWTKEAVTNLVKNALDHTEAGGVVKVSWKSSSAVFRLTVEDDGCGIAPEDIHHIFKQFYRSRNSGDRQGAGLGLSLAKAIVEGQGGNLSVASSPGEGSVFFVTFLAEPQGI